MQKPIIDFPRIFVAGLSGGAGKTILSIGIIAAWKRYGKSIASFKKGPDYIDAGWLALAAGRPCYNLDSFIFPQKKILRSFLSRSINSDISVIEGNRGLFDGIDIAGATSSAEMAKLLKTPVILSIDCTKVTRTVAAIILGCMKFDPDLNLAGVILNRIAGPRHEKNLRQNIEHYCGIPVVGAVPKLDAHNFPERHMGLVPTPEHDLANAAVDATAKVAVKYLDLNAIEKIALKASSHLVPIEPEHEPLLPENKVGADRPKIGIIKDSAFQFYYPDNIEALENAGAHVVFINAIKDKIFPDVDALYIGGGFPETHAKELSKNRQIADKLKELAENNMPVYAECGGLMYLGEALIVKGKKYTMTGVLPIVFGVSQKPQGLGYSIAKVNEKNPYFKKGTEIRGHEFRYSRIIECHIKEKNMIFDMKRGTGFINKKDGILYKNVFASYTHIHVFNVPKWAEAMVENALKYKKEKKK